MSETKQTLKSLFILLVFAGFMTAFYFLIGEDKSELPSQLINQPAPKFNVEDLLDAEIRHTNQEFIGRITLLNVWASWCPSCYDEHPYWKGYAKNSDLTLVGLNYRDKKDNALKFLRQQGNVYDWNLFDHDGRLGIEFGVYGAPETFLIDKQGNVRYRHVGVVTPDVFRDTFLPLIEKIKKGF